MRSAQHDYDAAGRPRPETGPEVPHVQLTQTSPPTLRDELTWWMANAFPHTASGPSEISDPGKVRRWIVTAFPGAPVADDIPDEKAVALLLDGVTPAPGAVLLPPRLTVELARIHPDGSLHPTLSTQDQHEVVDKGWGERHPLYSPQVNVMMLYEPRDADELDIARTVLTAAYRYATVAPWT